jgi:cell division protein FtsL
MQEKTHYKIMLGILATLVLILSISLWYLNQTYQTLLDVNEKLPEIVAQKTLDDVANAVNSVSSQNYGYLTATFGNGTYECFQRDSPAMSELLEKLSQ